VSVDLPVTLRLLSHELRTPTGVIQGYSKMLLEDRIADDMRPAVVAQMQRAVARVALIAQQSHDLLHWISDLDAHSFRDVPIAPLLDDIRARVTTIGHVTVEIDPRCADRRVRTSDPMALAEAGAAIVVDAARQAHGEVTLAVRPAEAMDALDFCAFPSPLADAPRPAPCGGNREQLDVHAAGLGLSLLLASAVVEAHGGWIWQQSNTRVFGMTLPCAE
jgi:signal transduction histidine kinase